MEPLFRLTLNRPAVEQDRRAPSIPLAQPSPFQQQLAQAQQTQRPRDAMQRVARQFVTTTGFTGDPAELTLQSQLRALSTALDGLERRTTVTNAATANAIQAAFGAAPIALVSSQTLDGARASLRDSLIA